MYCSKCDQSGVLTTFNGRDYYYYCRGCKEELVLEAVPTPPKQSGEPQIEWPAANGGYCNDPTCNCSFKPPTNAQVASTPNGTRYYQVPPSCTPPPTLGPTPLTQDEIDALFSLAKGIPLQIHHIIEPDKVYD